MITVEPNKKKCKGAIYKANTSQCKSKQGFGIFIRLNKVANLSCKGCDECGWILEALDDVSNDWPVIGLDDAEDGKLYELNATNIETDWETGIIDNYNLQIIEHNEDT